MPKGGRRPNSGPSQTPLAVLKARGTFRPDRHQTPAIGNVVAMPPALAVDWEPTPESRVGLSPRAIEWLDGVLVRWQFSSAEGLRVMDTARTISRIEAIESVLARDGLVAANGTPHALATMHTREARLLLVSSHLKLRKCGPTPVWS